MTQPDPMSWSRVADRVEAICLALPETTMRSEERKVLLAIGPPYFDSRGGFGRIEVLLNDDTDWEEIRELVTESYRTLAPKKLIALLDDKPETAHRDNL